MITAVMVHFIVFHYRRMKIKYEENSNIKIRETLENKEKEVPSLAAMVWIQIYQLSYKINYLF